MASAVVYAGTPVDAYLEEQGMGEVAYNQEEVEQAEEEQRPILDPEPATTDTREAPTTRHPAHDRLAALVVAHLNSPYAVAIAAGEHAQCAHAELPTPDQAKIKGTPTQQQTTLSRRGQLILVSLFGTVIAYPGLSSSSSNATANATSTWAIVWRMTPPLIILSGVVALWATSHSTPTTPTANQTIPRQIEAHTDHPSSSSTRLDAALHELTKQTVTFVQEWAEWETLAGKVLELLDTLDKKRQRKQKHRPHSSSYRTRRRSNSIDWLPEGEDKIYDILHELCAEIEKACSELFIEKYATSSDGNQEQINSGIDMQELKLLLEMYVPHTVPTPIISQGREEVPPNTSTSPRLSHEELIKARRRSWAALPTASSTIMNANARETYQASSSPIARARSSESHAANSLPATPIRIRYPTSPIHASTPRSSTTPQAHLPQSSEGGGGVNQGSASKVRGQRKRYSEQCIAHSPSSSIAGHEIVNLWGPSPTNPSPLSIAMATASSSAASQSMQRAATTGSHSLIYDGTRPEAGRSSLDSPRGLIASGRLALAAADMPIRRIQAHHPSSPSLSVSSSPAWANASPSISRIKQRPLSTPNGLGLDWRSYQDQPSHTNAGNNRGSPHANPTLHTSSAHKRHSSSFSTTRYAEHISVGGGDSGKKARPTNLYLQASPKLLSPSSRNGGRFEVSYSGHEGEEEEEDEVLCETYAQTRGIKVQEDLCRLERKRKEILCIILALRAVPVSAANQEETDLEQKKKNITVLLETCQLLGTSLSDLSTILANSSSSLREACKDYFGTAFSNILLPHSSHRTKQAENAQDRSYFSRFPGQYPSSPMIEVESASPSPTGSSHVARSQSRRQSTGRRQSRSRRGRRGRSTSTSSTSSSVDDQDNFAPKQAVPLYVREAISEYNESSEKIETLLADLAMNTHMNKREMEEYVQAYRGDKRDSDTLLDVLDMQEELKKHAQSLLTELDSGRLALRRIRDTSRTSAATVPKQEERSSAEEYEEEDTSADITFSEEFLNKRGSLSSTLSSSNNDEIINTPPLKPSFGNPEISLSSSTSSSSAGIDVARNTISQLLLDPANADAKNMPAFLNFQEKLYETYTAPPLTTVEQAGRANNKLSREERIALTKAKREAAKEREDARGEEEGVDQPTATLELVQELKDVVKILRERRAPVMAPEQAEDA